MQTLTTRTDFLDLLPKGLVIAELGVFKGEFSEQILERCSPARLYLVDTFNGRVGSGDKDGKNMQFIDVSKEYFRLLQHPSPVIRLVRASSTDFLLNMPDNSLDMVYIDTSHDFISTRYELKLSLPKVKPGGWIAGHDYGMDGVKKAIYEFCAKLKVDIEYLTQDGQPSFAIKKPQA